MLGVVRPSQGKCDIGAFEFSDGNDVVVPEPPQNFTIR